MKKLVVLTLLFISLSNVGMEKVTASREDDKPKASTPVGTYDYNRLLRDQVDDLDRLKEDEVLCLQGATKQWWAMKTGNTYFLFEDRYNNLSYLPFPETTEHKNKAVIASILVGREQKGYYKLTTSSGKIHYFSRILAAIERTTS